MAGIPIEHLIRLETMRSLSSKFSIWKNIGAGKIVDC